ncbi:MAG: phosphoesterase [Clostridiales bacterium]|nr:phosphoesterase [Clostridiales bacterium]
MKLFYDLHIHSCLSPCGSDEMTPNNIVNMAYLKGLNIISVTDHNTGKNCDVISRLGKKNGILVIPGMEIQTKEEVHILCYFPHLDALNAFEVELDQYRIQIPNRPEKFGNQWIMDEDDIKVEDYPLALILSVNIGLDQLNVLVEKYGGVIVPAHVNKSSNSMLSNLGFIPETLDLKYVEVFMSAPVPKSILDSYDILKNSDAHSLGQISEPENSMELKEKTINAVIDFLKRRGTL